jgi:membrane-bound inhibitor of C-type lysozyme
MKTITLQRKEITLGSLALAAFGLCATSVTSAQQAPSPAAEAPKPAASPGPTNNIRPAMKWKEFNYTCEKGAKLTVYLRSTTAKVRTQDHLFLMRQTPSAEGTRYSDGKVLWWSKGDTGFLQEDTPDGDGNMLVKGCMLGKPTDAAKP